ncbi:MAG: hypothetical protein ACR2HQ_12860 [Ilumatobacteraceae bacterium]
MPRRIAVTMIVSVAAFGVVACSDSQQEELGETVDSIAQDVQDAANTIVSNAQEAAGDAVDAAAELAARNLAAEQGGDAFEAAGHPLTEAGLACEATATDDASALNISCAGQTQAGEDVMLTGTTSELPGASLTELVGQFSGTVAGAEVFKTERLGG